MPDGTDHSRAQDEGTEPQPNAVARADSGRLEWSVDVPFSNRVYRRNFRTFLAVAFVPFTVLALFLLWKREWCATAYLTVALGAVLLLLAALMRFAGRAMNGTFVVDGTGVTYTPGTAEKRLTIGAGSPSPAGSVGALVLETRVIPWRRIARADVYRESHAVRLRNALGLTLIDVYCDESVWDAFLEIVRGQDVRLVQRS